MTAPSSTRGTLSHFIASRWRDLNKRCVNGTCARPHDKKMASYFRDGVRLEMTRGEFAEWCRLKWPEIETIYKSGETPSLDRIRVTEPYSIGNVRILSRGENSRLARRPQRKLSSDEANEVKKRLATGERQVDIAADYGLSQVAVSLIKRGKSYAH